MRKSETIGKIAEALAKAQTQFPAIPKDREVEVPTKSGGKYKYSYATMAKILDLVRKPLAENGLAISQNTGVVEGRPVMTSTLLHSSGEWLEASWPMNGSGSMQEKGSEITYVRRYLLTGQLGIIADDDEDGSLANERDKGQPCRKPAGPASSPTGGASGKVGASPGPKPSAQGTKPSREQLNRLLMNLYKPYLQQFPETQFADLLHKRYQVNETRLMSVEQLDDLVQYLQKRMEAKGAEPAAGPKPQAATPPAKSGASNPKPGARPQSATRGAPGASQELRAPHPKSTAQGGNGFDPGFADDVPPFNSEQREPGSDG